MTDLIPISTSLFPTRVERTTGRALGRVRAAQQLAAAQEVARVEVVAEVTEAALLATAHISALESLMADRVPHAEGRLHQIANAGVLGMTAVVVKAGRRVS